MSESQHFRPLYLSLPHLANILEMAIETILVTIFFFCAKLRDRHDGDQFD